MDLVEQQNDLIRNVSARGELILEVVKLILSLLKGDLKHRLSIIKNYVSFTHKISNIEICIKGRILEVAKHYNVEVSSRNEELKMLIAQFSKLKAKIQNKFATFLKSVSQKKARIQAERLEFSKILKLNDDFILQRYLASNREFLQEKEEEFQNNLLDQAREIMDLDSQILQEFDKILHEIDKKEISSVSSWNPLTSFNEMAVQDYFNRLPVIKHHVTERIAFSNKKCSKMQLFTIYGDRVYCFTVVSGSDVEKMAGKFNFRQELQTLVGHKKHNVHYFESKTPVFSTTLSKVDLYSVATDSYIKIRVPSTKWYKKQDKLTLYFRDNDEMKEFMDAFELELPGTSTSSKKKERISSIVESENENDSPKNASAANLETEFLSQEEKEGRRFREDSQATLKNDLLC